MPGKYSVPARRRPGGGVNRRSAIAVCAMAVVVLVFAPSSVLTSCARKGTKSDKPQGEAQGSIIPSAIAALHPDEASEGSKPKPKAALASSLRGFGLRAPSAPRIAWDFSLGPLQSYRPSEGDEAAVFAVATSFVSGIAAGKLDKQLLFPAARDALSVLLAAPAPLLGLGARYNIGSAPSSCEARTHRSSFGFPQPRTPARIEGLLSLKKADGTWYVEALALDPPVTGALIFNPDSSAGDLDRTR